MIFAALLGDTLELRDSRGSAGKLKETLGYQWLCWKICWNFLKDRCFANGPAGTQRGLRDSRGFARGSAGTQRVPKIAAGLLGDPRELKGGSGSCSGFSCVAFARNAGKCCDERV
jgi:hypothetical protein